jgi:sarcosine oxidase
MFGSIVIRSLSVWPSLLPGHPEVVVTSPCSGHGFKFASVIGEILADLIITGSTRMDLSLFRYERLATAEK